MKYVVYAKYNEDNSVVDAARAAHLQYATSLREAGKLALGGPMVDRSGALFIYECESLEEVTRYVDEDPFSTSGAFASREIKAWRLLGVNPELLKV